MKYRDLGVDGHLKIDIGKGQTRGVCFADAESKRAALEPGRSLLDRLAIERGFLPRGGVLVLRPSPTVEPGSDDLPSKHPQKLLSGSWFGFSDEGLCDDVEHISRESDDATRRDRPNDALLYERLINALHGAPDDPVRWKHVLLVDVLGGEIELDDRAGAIRTNCHLHPDRGMSLYAYGGATRFHCFSCGASGNQVQWAMLRHRLSREEADRLAAVPESA
jgi:hypothetical protein